MCAEQDPTSRRYAGLLHALLSSCHCMALMYRSIGCCLGLRSASCSTTPTTTTRRGSSFGSPPTEAGVCSPSPVLEKRSQRCSPTPPMLVQSHGRIHTPRAGCGSLHPVSRREIRSSSYPRSRPNSGVVRAPQPSSLHQTLRHSTLSLTLCRSVQATYRRRGSPSTWDPAGKRPCQASLTFSFVACLMRPHGNFERMPAHSCPTTTPYGTAATTRPTACAHGIYKVRASQCSESAIGLTTLTTTTLVCPYAQDRATVRPGSCSSDTPTTLRSPARSPPTHGPFPQ